MPAARASVPAHLPSVPVAASGLAAPETASGTGFGRWLLVLAAGLVVVGVFGYRVLGKPSVQSTPVTAAPPEPVTQTTPAPAIEPSAAMPAPASEAAPAASSAELAPAASAAEPEPAAAEVAAAAAATEPAPAGSATAAPSAKADASELRRVTVKSKPPKVRFFHFGKQVGVTPFVLELKPGERHAYEAGLPGYNTRKVVIDGSKPQITVGLTPEKR